MNSKTIITIVVAVLILAAVIYGGILAFRKTGSNNDQTALTGCPNGQNVISYDARGRFKPTIDLANKQAVLDTSMGKIVIQLYDQDAPKTVENFVCHIQQGYYNGVTFHRVAHGFVIQGGDPQGTGQGGVSVYGDTFEDELYPDTPSYQAGYVKGVVAMANRGPNTNGSQFFILLGDKPDLEHKYTIFGKVAAGQDVVDKIGALPVTPVFGPDDGTPKTKVTINSATIQNAQ